MTTLITAAKDTRVGMINSTFYSKILDLSYTPKGRLTLNLSTIQGYERFLRSRINRDCASALKCFTRTLPLPSNFFTL